MGHAVLALIDAVPAVPAVCRATLSVFRPECGCPATKSADRQVMVSSRWRHWELCSVLCKRLSTCTCVGRGPECLHNMCSSSAPASISRQPYIIGLMNHSCTSSQQACTRRCWYI
jgi:hypothetical protein